MPNAAISENDSDREALRVLLHRLVGHAGSQTATAKLIGVSDGTINGWLGARCAFAWTAVTKGSALLAKVRPSIASRVVEDVVEVLLEQHGTWIPAATPTPRDLTSIAIDLAAQSGGVFVAVRNALADGKVTREEATAILDEVMRTREQLDAIEVHARSVIGPMPPGSK